MGTAATAMTSAKDSNQSSSRPPTTEELMEVYGNDPALDAANEKLRRIFRERQKSQTTK